MLYSAVRCFVAGCLSAATSMALADRLPPPQVVSTVDLGRYMGTWYEIASNRPLFQADCFCTTATYTLREGAEPVVGVRNACNRGSAEGRLTTVEGEARIPNPSVPAKLNVRFGPIALPGTNYWIIALADDYSWAVVSTATRTPLYILARDRGLAQPTVDGILDDLTDKGFDTSVLDFTVQNGCSAN